LKYPPSGCFSSPSLLIIHAASSFKVPLIMISEYS
jgi:hypothetical protein